MKLHLQNGPFGGDSIGILEEYLGTVEFWVHKAAVGCRQREDRGARQVRKRCRFDIRGANSAYATGDRHDVRAPAAQGPRAKIHLKKKLESAVGAGAGGADER